MGQRGWEHIKEQEEDEDWNEWVQRMEDLLADDDCERHHAFVESVMENVKAKKRITPKQRQVIIDIETALEEPHY